MLTAGFRYGSHTFFGCGMDKVDPRFGVLGQPQNLAESNILLDIVVHQVQVVSLVIPLPL